MKKVINFRLTLLFALSISLGIFTAYLFKFNHKVAGFISVASFIFVEIFFCFFIGRKIYFKWLSITLSLLVFWLGVFGFIRVINSFNRADLNGHSYVVQAKVTESLKTDYGSRLILSNVSIKGNVSGRTGYKIALYVYGQESFDIGDQITFESVIKDKPYRYENRLAASDIERNVKYMASIDGDKITVIGKNLSVFEKVNLFIRETLKEGLEEEQFSVAYAMLTGFSEYVDEDVITSYRQAGVAHVFAVSGLHIGFLAAALEFVFRKLRINKLIKAVSITLILLFYSGVCGFSSSSIRATIMCSTALFCNVIGKRYDGLSALSLAFVLILCFSPVQLFCVGFQLSFMVVLGIILLGPPISKALGFLPKKLASSLGSVLAAQIVGIPISLAAFKEFSTIAVIANIIFIPIVGVIFIALIVATILGGLFSISHVTLYLLNFALKIINALITAFDYEIFMVGGFTLGCFCIFYYLAVFLPSGLFNLSRLFKILSFTLCTLTCIAGSVLINVNERKGSSVYIVGSQTICATVLSSGGENTLIISSANSVFSASRLKRLSDKSGIDNFDGIIVTSGCAADVQAVATKLYPHFKISQICYYGERDDDIEQIIMKSFGIKATSYKNDEKLPVSEFFCSFDLDGKAVNIGRQGKVLTVFSQFGKYSAHYDQLSVIPDCIIAYDYCYNIYEYFGKIKTISYLESNFFTNAQKEGTLKLDFNELAYYNV